MFLLGDRSEPHVEHAARGLLAAIQSYALELQFSASHLLGPGATLTEANRIFLASNAPDLAERRKKGNDTIPGNWAIQMVPEVVTILDQRHKAEAADELEWNGPILLEFLK